jgi:hypothetical protein
MNQNFDAISKLVPLLGDDIAAAEVKQAELIQQVEQGKFAIADLEEKVKGLRAELAVPKPSGFSRVLSNLNRLAWIVPPTAVGNSNPNPTDPHGQFPMTPGDYATWHCKPIQSYDNGFWYLKNYGFESFKRFAITMKIIPPSATAISSCQAVEMQWQKSFDSYIYNMAWQIPGAKAGQDGRMWRTFDFVNKGWIATDIPTKAWAPGVPVFFYAEGVVDTDAKTVTHQVLRVDDKIYFPNITRPAKLQPERNYLSTGFQLDVLGRMKDGKKDTSYVPPAFDFQTTEMHLLY